MHTCTVEDVSLPDCLSLNQESSHRVGAGSEVCAGRYGTGRVRARCERDEEGVVGESGHGLSAFLDRIFSAARLYPLRDGP